MQNINSFFLVRLCGTVTEIIIQSSANSAPYAANRLQHPLDFGYNTKRGLSRGANNKFASRKTFANKKRKK